MASRYWVGGSGTWDTSTTTNWSATSGGTGGASVPAASDDVIINGSSGSPTITLTGALVCQSITTTGATCTFTSTGTLTVSGNITLSSTTTWAATGTITTAANCTITAPSTTFSCGLTLGGFTTTLGSNITLSTTSTCTFNTATGTPVLILAGFTLSTGLFTMGSFNPRVIQFGTGNITVTGSGAAFSATGSAFSYTGTPTINISNNSATTTNVMATSFSQTNALNFNITTGTYALTVTNASVFGSLNFTGFTGTWAPGTLATITFYGSLTLVSGMTFTSSTAAWTFAATSGTQTINSGGKTLGPITQAGLGGTVALGSNVTMAGTSSSYTLTAGTLNLAGFTLKVPAWNSSNSNTRVIAFGSGGSITISDNSSAAFTMTTATGYSYTGTGTISFLRSSGTVTFAGGGGSYPTLNLGGAGVVAITGANTFANINNTTTGARTLTLPASTTTTVNAFNLAGVSGSLVTINSSTSGTQATMNLTTGAVANSDYLSIKDSNVTPSTGTWYAGAHSTNVSNNTGWIFTAYPASSGNFFMFF